MKEFDRSKIGALPPGHHPSIKDGLPLKLRLEKRQPIKHVTVKPLTISLHLNSVAFQKSLREIHH